jgi:hypothetical protein
MSRRDLVVWFVLTCPVCAPLFCFFSRGVFVSLLACSCRVTPFLMFLYLNAEWNREYKVNYNCVIMGEKQV